MATNRYILIWHLTLKVHLLFKNPGNFKKKKMCHIAKGS